MKNKEIKLKQKSDELEKNGSGLCPGRQYGG